MVSYLVSSGLNFTIARLISKYFVNIRDCICKYNHEPCSNVHEFSFLNYLQQTSKYALNSLLFLWQWLLTAGCHQQSSGYWQTAVTSDFAIASGCHQQNRCWQPVKYMDDTLGLNMYNTDPEASYVSYIHLNWNYNKHIWAVTWDFQQCGVCDQQRLRQACAYAQSDQSLCLSLEYSMSVKLLSKHHLKFLSLQWWCTGSSESTLVKTPHCWKSRVTAHIKVLAQSRFATYVSLFC